MRVFPPRHFLVWTKRVCATLQGLAFVYLGYRNAWGYVALMIGVCFLEHLETVAAKDIETLDERKERAA